MYGEPAVASGQDGDRAKDAAVLKDFAARAKDTEVHLYQDTKAVLIVNAIFN